VCWQQSPNLPWKYRFEIATSRLPSHHFTPHEQTKRFSEAVAPHQKNITRSPPGPSTNARYANRCRLFHESDRSERGCPTVDPAQRSPTTQFCEAAILQDLSSSDLSHCLTFRPFRSVGSDGEVRHFCTDGRIGSCFCDRDAEIWRAHVPRGRSVNCWRYMCRKIWNTV
jgi:hypothetical protein